MEEYLNATCNVCGKPYHKCDSCKNVKTYMPWRSIVCSPECYKIFMAISRYTRETITKEEAREILEQYDFSNMEGYSESVKRAVKEIMQDDKHVSAENNNKKKQKTKNIKIRYEPGYYRKLSKKVSEDDNE